MINYIPDQQAYNYLGLLVSENIEIWKKNSELSPLNIFTFLSRPPPSLQITN